MEEYLQTVGTLVCNEERGNKSNGESVGGEKMESRVRKDYLKIYEAKKKIEDLYPDSFISVILIRCNTNTFKLNWR